MNLVAALLLGASPQPAEAAAPACGSAEAAVREVERRWLAAYRTRDRMVMNEVLTPDFRITHPNGRVQSKADVLAAIAGRSDREGPRFATRDVAITCRPGVAILSGWVLEETRGEASAARYTDTYVFAGGRWRVLASHLSRPPQR